MRVIRLISQYICMPIYPKLGCIFVHIPKTGGQSINQMLEEAERSYQNDGEFEFAHLTARQIEKRLELKWFSFAIVRNPLHRIMSEYSFSQKYRPYLLNYELSFPEYVRAIYELDKAPLNHVTGNHLYTQSSFIYENDQLLVDYVGRFESLQASVDEVGIRLNRQLPALPHINESKQVLECDSQTEELIRIMYQEDYVHFGYQ